MMMAPNPNAGSAPAPGAGHPAPAAHGAPPPQVTGPPGKDSYYLFSNNHYNIGVSNRSPKVSVERHLQQLLCAVNYRFRLCVI